MSAVEVPTAPRRGWWTEYFYEAVPLRRFDALSALAYFVVAFTVFVSDRWAVGHADAPAGFYHPLALARLVRLPAPTPTTMLLLQLLLAACCLAGWWRRAPRAVAAVTLAGYTTWLLWAFSFGKVDHDRLTILVVLAVLATTDRRGPLAPTRAGWGIRLVQVAFAVAYPLSAMAKLRYGGVDWMNGATFTRAIVRRGTFLGEWMLHAPTLLRLSQWGFVVFELFAVCLLLRRGTLRKLAIVGVFLLHAVTYVMITISFLPHSVFLLAFLPLEKWWPGGQVAPDEADPVVPESARPAVSGP